MLPILLHFLPHILAAALYGGLGFHFWRSRWEPKDQPRITDPMHGWERGLIFLAWLVQGYALYGDLAEGPGMRFSFALALSLILWLAVLIYWVESFHARLEGLQPLVLPLAALCALTPAAFPAAHELAHAESLGFRLHFLAAMLAYGLFTLAALHTIFMGFAARQLHRKALTRSLASLPPLLTMETLLFRMLAIAFILLTVALVSGVLFSEAIFGKPLMFDHKTLFAFASWSIFALLLVGRRVYGWRGKVAQRWTLTGFAVLLLAYVGSRFVLEVLIGRTP